MKFIDLSEKNFSIHLITVPYGFELRIDKTEIKYFNNIRTGECILMDVGNYGEHKFVLTTLKRKKNDSNKNILWLWFVETKWIINKQVFFDNQITVFDFNKRYDYCRFCFTCNCQYLYDLINKKIEPTIVLINDKDIIVGKLVVLDEKTGIALINNINVCDKEE